MNVCSAVSNKCLYLQSGTYYCSGNLGIIYRTSHNNNMMANKYIICILYSATLIYHIS